MKLKLLDEKKPCTKCSGYGVFNSSHELIPCSGCGSIHAEALGMTYPIGELKTKLPTAKYLYVTKNWLLT